jgi:predicted Zn-dependent peptidase
MLISEKLEKSIEQEREVIINEFKRKYPISFKYDERARIQKILHEGHTLERLVCSLGSQESIRGVTQDDLQRYYDSHYTPANISVVAVGGCSMEQIVTMVSESPLGMYKSGIRTQYVPLDSFPALSETHTIIKISDLISSIILDNAGYESYARIPHSVVPKTLSMFCNMLNKLLVATLREEMAITYAVRSTWSNFMDFYKFCIECSSFNIDAAPVIQEVVESVVMAIPLSRALFEKVKKERLSSLPMLDSNASEILTDAMADIRSYNRIISLTSEKNDIKNVSFEDVCAVIPYVLADKRYTRITMP